MKNNEKPHTIFSLYDKGTAYQSDRPGKITPYMSSSDVSSWSCFSLSSPSSSGAFHSSSSGLTGGSITPQDKSHRMDSPITSGNDSMGVSGNDKKDTAKPGTDKRRKQRPDRHGWTTARRAAQVKRMRKTKPWTKATGPKTTAGKARVARNAYKHGFRSEDFRELCRLLRIQKRFIKDLSIDYDIKNGIKRVHELITPPDNRSV